MVEAANPPKTTSGRGRVLVLAVVAGAFALGAGAGLYAGGFLGAASEPSPTDPHAEGAAEEEGHAESEPAGVRMELDVGRITVIIPSDTARGGNLHLLISPIVVAHPIEAPETGGHGSGAAGEPVGPVAELRDSFIEYLSQLRDTDIRGSLGLVTLRAELLRRARLVAPDLNASAVLIQEFLIQ